MKLKYTILLLLLLPALTQCKAPKAEGTAQTISDEALLDTIERRTFNYFWDGAEPNSGLARERIHLDGDYPGRCEIYRRRASDCRGRGIYLQHGERDQFGQRFHHAGPGGGP